MCKSRRSGASMASGFIVSSQARATSNFVVASISRVLSAKCGNPSISSKLCSSIAHLNRFFCKCSRHQNPVDLVKYKDILSWRMAMAGLKPHHRIALGVSGGPDRIALCILTAAWKTNGLNTSGDSCGFIDGLLAIIADHAQRAESKDEANIVGRRVSDMEPWRKSQRRQFCYAMLSAQKALQSLKSIPVAARRSLPVLVNSHGKLISIPSIGFKHCSCLMVSAVFKPRVRSVEDQFIFVASTKPNFVWSVQAPGYSFKYCNVTFINKLMKDINS